MIEETLGLAFFGLIWIGWCYLLAVQMSKNWGLDPIEYAFVGLIAMVASGVTVFALAAFCQFPLPMIALAVIIYGGFRAIRRGTELTASRRYGKG